MKTTNYLPFLLLTFLSSLIFLASCSDDDGGGGSLTPEDASVQLNAVATDMNDDVVTMVQSDGVQGALSLIDFIDNSSELGRVTPYQSDESKALFVQQSSKLAHYFTLGVADLLSEEPQDFTDFKGVYEWDPTLNDFNKIEESDILEIRFPVEESETNNGIFRLLEFEVVEIDFEELPTIIVADLSVDGEIQIDLDFSVNYSADGSPEKADIELSVLPFALDVSFDDTQATNTSLDATLLLEGANLVGIDVEVEFDSEEKIEPIRIEGEVSYGELRIIGSFSDTDMDNSDDGDPNDYFDLDLFIGQNKAGDIVFIFDNSIDDYVAYVQYADGTQENLEDILEDALNELEKAFDGV